MVTGVLVSTLERFIEDFKEVSTGYTLNPLTDEGLTLTKMSTKKADRIDGLKTQSVSDSDPSILDHSDSCKYFTSIPNVDLLSSEHSSKFPHQIHTSVLGPFSFSFMAIFRSKQTKHH